MKIPAQIRTQLYDKIKQCDLFSDLRKEYLNIINTHNVPYAKNIATIYDWLTYVYHCLLIEHLVPSKDATIVDWGGLYGHVTQILHTMGYHDAFNYILHHIPHYDHFQNHFQIPTRYGKDPNVLDLTPGSADVVISSGVLEHVREDGIGREDLILEEIHRVLKPDGYLFIWHLPAYLSFVEIRSILTRRWHHRFRYWKHRIMKLLREAGFCVKYCERTEFFPYPFKNLMEKRLNPVAVKKLDEDIAQVFPFSLLAKFFSIVATKA